VVWAIGETPESLHFALSGVDHDLRFRFLASGDSSPIARERPSGKYVRRIRRSPYAIRHADGRSLDLGGNEELFASRHRPARIRVMAAGSVEQGETP
jgi:hypothetical protein